MNKFPQKGMIVLGIILALLLLMWIYYFPLQRVMVEKKYEEYSKQQGIVAADIKTKEIYKDYKQGGYFISIHYHSDPIYRYRYHYFLIDHKTSGTNFNTMYCDVYDLENNLLDSYVNTIYRPLE